MTGIPESSVGSAASSERKSSEKFRLVVFGQMEDPDELRQILIESAQFIPTTPRQPFARCPAFCPCDCRKTLLGRWPMK